MSSLLHSFRLSIFTAGMLASLLSAPSFAETNRFSVLTRYPALSGFDYIRTVGTETLARGEFKTFAFMEYNSRPLEVTVAGTVSGIVDHVAVTYLGCKGAFSPYWDLEVVLPVIGYNRVSDPAVIGSESRTETGIGDVMLRATIRILPQTDNPIGLAVKPFFTFPSGNENHYISDPRSTGGFLFAIDRDFFRGDLSLAANAGLRARQHVVLEDLDTTAFVDLSAAAKYRFGESFDITLDLTHAASLKNPWGARVDNPAEVFVAGGFNFNGGNFRGIAGSAVALVRSAGVPLWRAFFGLVYGFGGRKP